MSFLQKKAVLVKMLLVLHVVIKIGSVMMLEFEADKITSLPGQPSVNFQHYSGYVYVSFANQTQTNHNNQKAMFYYFVEAETEPVSKPLVLWLNGGPGCSSLGVGAFSENGPFRPAGNRLITNNYSWNKGLFNFLGISLSALHLNYS